ncbi:DUF7281 domain-containing protein [Terrimonas alba]|uniref:DUF7281 domain-containing protein n=1 Tax=Terrimonas alba TaxID=3349636 RepID=UPI0035F273F0
MTLPFSIAEKLIAMLNGEKIPFSKVKHSVIDSMIDNGILKKQIQGRSKALVYLTNRNGLSAYLKNHFGIDSLENYVEALQRANLSRADAIDIASNSKVKSIRTFKGFLVNCFNPVDCILNKRQITIEPQEGTFTFIYDYEYFSPSDKITIVGIENPENFRHIQKQKKLFENIQPLFVSRYPQNKDLVRWLQTIPNNYLHFGDFDFSGLNIYFNEYKKHLKEKANFFLPSEIEKLLSAKGNRDNYSNQTIQFDEAKVDESSISSLLMLIRKYKKGLEQEVFSRQKNI